MYLVNKNCNFLIETKNKSSINHCKLNAGVAQLVRALRLVSGGVLRIDDYGHFKGAKITVDNFFKENKNIWMYKVDYTCRLIIKS